jgi:hypothetical protein
VMEPKVSRWVAGDDGYCHGMVAAVCRAQSMSTVLIYWNALTEIRNTAKEEKVAQRSSLSFNARWSIFGSTRNFYWKLKSGVLPNFTYFLHVIIGCALTQASRFPSKFFLISHS